MRPYASVYLTVLAMGAPIMIFASAGGNILRAEGAVKQSMFRRLPSTVTNIILDPIFILVLKLGVGGVVIATVIGNALGLSLILSYTSEREKAACACIRNLQRRSRGRL